MRKIIFRILITILLIQLVGCTNDDNSESLFSPPKAIHGTWILESSNSIRLTISKNNIIEENTVGGFYPEEYIDFNQKFDANQYNVNETITNTSYEVIIERKDGEFIQEEYGITTFRRKYIKTFLNNLETEALELDYTGTNGTFLIRE